MPEFPDLHFWTLLFLFLCEYEVNMAVNAEKSERRELRRRWEAHDRVTMIDNRILYIKYFGKLLGRVLSPWCLYFPRTSDPWYWSICGGLCGTAEFKNTRCSRTDIKSTYHNIFQASFKISMFICFSLLLFASSPRHPNLCSDVFLTISASHYLVVRTSTDGLN